MFQSHKYNYTHIIVVLTLLIGLGASTNLSAQFKVYGIIKTTNKKKYHGEVITYEPNKQVKMNCQGDTMSFDLNISNFKFTTRRPPKPYVFPDGVWYNRLVLGTLVGRPGDGGHITYSYHYQKNHLLGYGGSLGFENYGTVDGYDFLVPGAVFHSYFRKKNSTPFARVFAGYGYAIKNTSKDQTKAQGGINLGAALGLRLSTNRVMIDFTAGTKYQKAYYEFDFGDFSKTSDIQFLRFDFSIGFMW